jgi:hypothetical protein
MKFGIDFTIETKTAEAKLRKFLADYEASVKKSNPWAKIAGPRDAAVQRFDAFNLSRRFGNLNEKGILDLMAKRQAKAQELLERRSLVGSKNIDNFTNPLTGKFNYAAARQYAKAMQEIAVAQAKAAAAASQQAQAQQAVNTQTAKAIPLFQRLRKAFGNAMSGGGGGGSRGSFLGAENYDPQGFSVRKLLRSFQVYATGYLSVRGLYHLAQTGFDSAYEREKSSFANSVAFGSRGRADAAYMGALRSGSPFAAESVMTGNAALARVGVTNQSTRDMAGNMAGRLGLSYDDAAGDIVSAINGDYTILTKYGLTQRDLMPLKHLQGGTPRMRNAVMGLLQSKQMQDRFKNGMQDFAKTWEGTMNTLRNQRKNIWAAILGDPSDKNSLYGAFKGTFTKISAWITANQDKIERFGKFLGKVLTSMWQKAEAFARKVGGVFKGVLDKFFGTEEQYAKTTRKVLLFMELLYQKMLWIKDNFPLTGLFAALAAPSVLGKIAAFGVGIGSSFRNGIIKGFFAVEAASFAHKKLIEMMFGSTEENVAKVLAKQPGAIENLKANVYHDELGLSERLFGYTFNKQPWEKEAMRRAIRDPKYKGVGNELFNQMYGTNYGANMQPITINVQGLVTPDVLKMVADTVQSAVETASAKEKRNAIKSLTQ